MKRDATSTLLSFPVITSLQCTVNLLANRNPSASVEQRASRARRQNCAQTALSYTLLPYLSLAVLLTFITSVLNRV